jgi:hypothetical protein
MTELTVDEQVGIEEAPVYVKHVITDELITELNDWFKYLTGFYPTKDQLELMTSIIVDDRILVSAGRQSGKTLTVSVAAMYLAFKFGYPLKILLLSPQDNAVYFYMRNFFRRHKDDLTENLVGSKSSQNIVPLGGFQLEGGTHVNVTGVTEKNIRGFPADVVIIDETYLVDNNNILTALGNLSGPVSKFILLSTPGPNEKSLFMKWLNKDPKINEFHIFHWSSVGLPWHNKALFDTKKEELSPSQWASEVLGRAPTDDEVDQSKDVIGLVIFSENKFSKMNS